MLTCNLLWIDIERRMIFNSFSFLVFFVFVFICYAIFPHKTQNRFLLISSYFFYAAWDYRFCGLLLITTIVDFSAGQLITKFRPISKTFLIASICINLSILGLFKYYNFFIDSFIQLTSMVDLNFSPFTLNIILPVGISFYTFQSMSYTIDLYRKEIKPISNFFDYALYVSFFPQLVAGPIERAQHLLPQILKPRLITFAGIQKGFYYISAGLCLKIFVADNIARLIDPIFRADTIQTGFQYLIAGYGFTFQIYGDFAGYSYIAMGLGAVLGFDIMNNFNLPYFSQNPREFWQRWHISLSSWLRDYLYISLGGNRISNLITIRNLFITMLLGGLWHGAKITFVLWGGIHGLLLIGYHSFLLFKARTTLQVGFTVPDVLKKTVNILIFFHIIVFTWYFFRAESLDHVIIIFQALVFNFNPSADPELTNKLAFFILPLLIFQLFQVISKDQLFLFKVPIILRAVSYVIIFYLITIFGVNHAQDFIYFQF